MLGLKERYFVQQGNLSLQDLVTPDTLSLVYLRLQGRRLNFRYNHT